MGMKMDMIVPDARFELYNGPYNGGKTYFIAQRAKMDRRFGIMVRDLKSLDIYIEMGVQPSQLFLASEMKDHGTYSDLQALVI